MNMRAHDLDDSVQPGAVDDLKKEDWGRVIIEKDHIHHSLYAGGESPNKEYLVALKSGFLGERGAWGRRKYVDGVVVLVRNSDKVVLWSRRIKNPGFCGGCAVSDDGKVAVIDDSHKTPGPGGGRFYVFDKNGTILVDRKFDNNLQSCAISKDGKKAIATSSDVIFFFDVESGKLKWVYKSRIEGVLGVSFSEDDRILVYTGNSYATREYAYCVEPKDLDPVSKEVESGRKTIHVPPNEFLNPGELYARMRVRQVYETATSQEKLEEAKAHFWKGIKQLHDIYTRTQNPAYISFIADVCEYLGRTYLAEGAPHKAIPFFKRSQELYYSNSLRKKSEYEKALQELNGKEIEIDPILDVIKDLPSHEWWWETEDANGTQQEKLEPKNWNDLFEGADQRFQHEAKIIERYWDENCTQALKEFVAKFRWNAPLFMFDQMSRVLGRAKMEELNKRLGEGRARQVITWGSMAKKEMLGLSYPPPMTKKCKYCNNEFFEGDVHHSLAYYFNKLDAPLDYCERCLASAFWGAHKKKKSVRSETLKRDIRNLVDAFGFIPPKSVMLGLDRRLAEIIPRERLDKVVLALIEMSHPVVYEMHFGSWFKALVASGVLVEDAQRTTFGVRCLAKDGHECLSFAEKVVDDWLYQHGISHIIEPFYPIDNHLNPNGLMRADWQARGFFIEYFGLVGLKSYEEKIRLKRKLCEKHGVKLLEITFEDLFDLDAKLQLLKKVVRTHTTT